MLPVVIFKYCGVSNSNLPFEEKSWVIAAVEKSVKKLLGIPWSWVPYLSIPS